MLHNAEQPLQAVYSNLTAKVIGIDEDTLLHTSRVCIAICKHVMCTV